MTSMMLRRCLTAVALAALAAVIALSPVSSAEAAPSLSPFAGSWSGTWSVIEVEVVGTGTFDWTISDAGRITGTVCHTPTGSGGTMVGHVGADGKLMIIGYAPADEPGGAFNGIPFQGTAMIDGSGKLVVSATRTDSNRSLVATLERN